YAIKAANPSSNLPEPLNQDATLGIEMTELLNQTPLPNLHGVETNTPGSASADTVGSAEAVQSAWGTQQAVSTEPTSAGLSQPPLEDNTKDDGGREAAPSTVSSVAALHGSSGESDGASAVGGSSIATDPDAQHDLQHFGAQFESETDGATQTSGPSITSDDEMNTEDMAGATARPSSEVEDTVCELQAVPPEEDPTSMTGFATGFAAAAPPPNAKSVRSCCRSLVGWLHWYRIHVRGRDDDGISKTVTGDLGHEHLGYEHGRNIHQGG
ncbi:hypothetical protein H2201_002253, partial [Coniosporium apollinis]